MARGGGGRGRGRGGSRGGDLSHSNLECRRGRAGVPDLGRRGMGRKIENIIIIVMIIITGGGV